jgi:general stress protein YciG
MLTRSKPRGCQGFASLSPEQRREIAAKGGSSVPAEKRSFSQDRDLAENAGRKGGAKNRPETRSFFQNRDLAARAGQRGGQKSRPETRSFTMDRALAAAAGRKGGLARGKRKSIQPAG